MDDLTVAEVLERAADWLSVPGRWAQALDYVARDGSCACMIGAISVVSGEKPATVERESGPYRQLITRAIGDPNEFPCSWNDAPGRTQAEVVAKLREAAALAREQGQ